MNNIVYTYYDPTPGFDLEEAKQLMALWRDNWRANGWDPRVISIADAKAHARYQEFTDALSRLPTINGHGYEDTCYRRWIALAALGGGWLTDYDVMNYGFGPLALPDIFTVLSRVDYWRVPCVAGGTHAALERVVDAIIKYKPDGRDGMVRVNSEYWAWAYAEPAQGEFRPHCSDQTIFSRLEKETSGVVVSDEICWEAYRGMWAAAKMVHYPTGVTRPRGLEPKHAHIPQLRPLLH